MSTLKTNNIQHVDRSDPSIIINTDGSVNIAGTMTYEDVTNVDAVGIITGRNNIDAQKQIHVGTGVSVKAGGINVTAGITTVQALQATTGTFTSPVLISDGSVSAGGLAFADDTDTGMFSVAQNTINFATAGVERLEMGTSLTVFNDGGADVDFRIEGDTDANLFKLDAGTDRIGLGVAAPSAKLEVLEDVYVKGSSGDGSVGIQIRSGSSAISNQHQIRTGGGSGDQLFIEALGASSAIVSKVAGSERLRIGPAGQIGIAGANYGTSGQALVSQGSGSSVAWQTITGTTINTNADNRIITGSGTANTLNGEANLGFNGSLLDGSCAARFNQSGSNYLVIGSTSAGGVMLALDGDSNGDGSGGDYAYLQHDSAGNLNIVATNPADNSYMRFYTGDGSERMRLSSSGYLSLGNNLGQSTHMLYLSSTGDAGIHIRADSDNSGENDNPYVSFSQDGSNNQELKIGQNGVAGENFALSLDNSPFIHANHSAAYPLQLAHMDTMCVSISNRHNELGINNYSGCATAGMEIQHRGNDTGAALKLTGHNNTGTPGAETFTQLTHLGSNLTFEIFHAGARAIHLNSTRRVRLPGVPGVSGSGLSTVYIESDGNLCTQSSLREYKTNITSISDTSWLYNLNPVTFNWKKKTEVDGENVWEDTADDNGTQYGLIAEEVKEVKDDFCYYNNNGDLSGVHYDRMIAPLIKAVQDLKKEKDALETRIAALEGS